MATYLKVSNNASTTKYEAKSSAEKLYLKINTNYFPLTIMTSNKWGEINIVKNNKT